MANESHHNTLGLALPKFRPKKLTEVFSNRKSISKKVPQEQNRVSREVRKPQSVYGSSSSSISVNDQLRYLQKQHQELFEEHNIMKQDYRELLERHDKLKAEHSALEEDYNALKADFKNLEESQKTFNVRKILQLKFKKRADKETLEKRNIIQNEACFNTFLESVVKSDPLGIPKIIVECVTIVESSDKFMKSPGLYRVSGNHNTIQNLRYDINADNYKKLRKQKTPHEVCGVLKLFLRELKEPIISLALLNQIIPGPSDMIYLRTIKVLELVNSLDELRKNTLRFLMQHLKKVAAVEENEMDTTSLGILMSSCIFNETLSDVCPQRFEVVSAVPRECTRTMIECYDEIFAK